MRPVAAVAGAAGGVGLIVTASVVAGDLASRVERLDDAAISAPSAAVLDRVERRPAPPPGGVDEPLCVAVADCFAWRFEVSSPGMFPAPVAVTSSRVLVVHDDDAVRAHDLADGELLWERPGFASSSAIIDGVLTTDELAIALDHDHRLIALELADGSERWRSDPVPLREVWMRVDDGDQLRIAGTGDERSSDLRYGSGTFLNGVAAYDLATGEQRWAVSGLHVGLGIDGTVVADGDVLRGIGRDGEVVWDEALGEEATVQGVHVSGPLFETYAGHGEPAGLRRVADGAHVDVRGFVAASDADGAFGESWDTGSAPSGLWYVADGEVRWRRGVPDGYHGCGSELDATAVVVRLCDGGTVRLSRDDGRELGRTDRVLGDRQDLVDGHGPPIGPYVVAAENPVDWSGDLVVTDVRDGTEVARFPEGSHPVAVNTGSVWWSFDVDGLLLIATDRELVALAIPDTTSAASASEGRS